MTRRIVLGDKFARGLTRQTTRDARPGRKRKEIDRRHTRLKNSRLFIKRVRAQRDLTEELPAPRDAFPRSRRAPCIPEVSDP